MTKHFDTKTPVTELDFRMPEYRYAKVEDYEFREDGKLVRKDRWKTGMFKIAEAMGFNTRDGFEIDEVIAAVKDLADAHLPIDEDI